LKAVDTQLLDLLKKTSQFVVPIYQRQYSWGEAESLQLWNDILRAGDHDAIGAHFTGSIVYVSKGSSTNTASEPDLIIDGQQRVTTVSLVLAALADRLKQLPESDQEVHTGFTPKKIVDRYLLDPNEDDDRRFKLLLSAGDRDALKAVIQGFDLDNLPDSRVIENYKFFSKLLNDKKFDLVRLCKGLEKLVVVDVKLERGVDNPQLVFEAMNSTGKKLSQADLIRNFVLMELDQKAQSELYEGYWRPMEVLFSGSGDEQFDAFVRHFLTIKTGEIPRIGDVYDAFKTYVFTSKEVGNTISDIAIDLHKAAIRYSKIALGKEQDSELRSVFADLEQIKADVVVPFVLKVYSDYEDDLIDKIDFVKLIEFVVSYVFRRVVCKIPTNSMNKTFANLGDLIDPSNYLESAQAQFLLLQSYRRFPTDDEFRKELTNSDLYNFRRRSYFLRKLENHGRKEPVSIEEYSIEHILPQNPKLSEAWQKELGEDWANIQETYLHTLGNLTLTAYNPELSDNPFLTKRDIKGGFAQSPLNLNAGLGQLDHWTPQEIEARAEKLAALAGTIWQRPKLSDSDLAKYIKVAERQPDDFTLADHPNLTVTPARKALFEKLDDALLNLDPVVVRHYRQLYVVYKAESNFLSIVPQVGKMSLSINISKHELVDPRDLARDVSHMSRWGTGDVEVELNEESDFDYVFGLIRQAFELQLDSDL
jgi:uncharacterized protein with ParB-like and HNH nuclease domain/predicted transport protein